jgi:hypothetical protein
VRAERISLIKPDLDQTRRFLAAVMAPILGCCELRIFRATFDRGGFVTSAEQFSRTLAGWYDDPDKLIADASRLKGISGYVTVNPVRHDLLARADNRLIKAKHTTTDADIVCLRWLYVDIDPVRSADISSTDEEMEAAVERRNLILNDHPDLRAAALWGKSGNGCWILSRLSDYPNDPRHAQAIAGVLNTLSERYSTDLVKIDRATKNPSRVMCIPGLLKCKGDNRRDRPWRLATLDGVGEILA